MAGAATAIAASETLDRHVRTARDETVQQITLPNSGTGTGASVRVGESRDHQVGRARTEPVDVPAQGLLLAQMAVAAGAQTARSTGATGIGVNPAW